MVDRPDAESDPGAAPEIPLDQRGITLGAAFRGFLHIGLTGFGGVLPVVVHELVRRRRWITIEEFTDFLSLCQILPGPNVINFTVIFGMRLRGWRGVATCLFGLMALPVVIAIVLAVLHERFGDVPQVADAVRAVSASAAGLIAAMALRLSWPVRRDLTVLALAGFVVVLAGVLRLPLPVIVLSIGPLGVGLSFWRVMRSEAGRG